jgi:hypothetical protein
MMKHHGFTAREAMGWLRIVRPGSVIGEQQEFLCAREGLMRRSSAPLRAASAPVGVEGCVGAVERLIEETARAYDASYAAALGVARARIVGQGFSGPSLPPVVMTASVGPLPWSESAGDGRTASELAAHVAAAAERRSGVRCMGPFPRQGNS